MHNPYLTPSVPRVESLYFKAAKKEVRLSPHSKMFEVLEDAQPPFIALQARKSGLGARPCRGRKQAKTVQVARGAESPTERCTQFRDHPGASASTSPCALWREMGPERYA